MIKVLVADDESLARETIKHLLRGQDDIDCIIEADSGTKALALAQQEKPHIAFLDIQMPGMSGIELAEKLPTDCIIVFATAYDEYAITAFELNAIDYLLKPYDDERFFAAWDKAKQRLKEHNNQDIKEVGELLQHMWSEQHKHYKSRLVVRDPGRIRLVEVDQLNYIAGAGNYAELHLFDGKTILHRETMTSLESQLDPNRFARIHRSTIICVDSVCEIRPTDRGDYQVLLKSGDSLTLSRSHKDKLEALLS